MQQGQQDMKLAKDAMRASATTAQSFESFVPGMSASSASSASARPISDELCTKTYGLRQEGRVSVLGNNDAYLWPQR